MIQQWLLRLQSKLLTRGAEPEDGVACCAAAASAVQAAAPDTGVNSAESSMAGGVLISAVGGVMTLAASMSSGVCSCMDEQLCIGSSRRCWKLQAHMPCASLAELMICNTSRRTGQCHGCNHTVHRSSYPLGDSATAVGQR